MAPASSCRGGSSVSAADGGLAEDAAASAAHGSDGAPALVFVISERDAILIARQFA